MKGYVVIQRNTRGVVSIATAALDTMEEAQQAIRVNAATFPTLQFRVVELRPVTDWVTGSHVSGPVRRNGARA